MGVQIEGEGMNQTILNFADQQSGAQGLSVTSDNVTLQDFSIQNAKGDAIKVKGVTNIKFLRVKTEWTNGPNPESADLKIMCRKSFKRPGFKGLPWLTQAFLESPPFQCFVVNPSNSVFT